MAIRHASISLQHNLFEFGPLMDPLLAMKLDFECGYYHFWLSEINVRFEA